MRTKTLLKFVEAKLDRIREARGLGGVPEAEAARILDESLAAADPVAVATSLTTPDLRQELDYLVEVSAAFIEAFSDEGALFHWRNAFTAELATRAPCDDAPSVFNRERAALRFWPRSLFPYQRAFVTDTANVALVVKARQSGYSWSIAFATVKNAISEHVASIVLSASQNQSDAVLAKCRGHMQVLRQLGYTSSTVETDNSSKLALSNGGSITAMPASERTSRGASGDCYLDEFSYHVDERKIWDSVVAASTRGNAKRSFRLRIVSTPAGARGLFWQYCSDLPKGWSKHSTTIDEAIAQGANVDMQRCLENSGFDDRVFNQLYRCHFLDTDYQAFPSDLVLQCLSWTGQLPDLTTNETSYHLGWDVARSGDLSAIAIVARHRHEAYVIDVVTMKRTAHKDQKATILRLYDKYNPDSIHIDATGIGNPVAEDLADHLGDDIVKPITFTNQSKGDLMNRALIYMRDGLLRFPRNTTGEKLKDEAISVRRITNETTGNVSFKAPSTPDGHADRWTAVCLALVGCGDVSPSMHVSKTPLMMVY